MALRVTLDPIGAAGAPAGDYALPKSLYPTRPWQGPPNGPAYAAYRALTYLASKIDKQAKLAATEAARRDAIANNDWAEAHQAFAAQLKERLAEVRALQAQARASVETLGTPLAQLLAPADPTEAATFAAVWQYLAVPPGASESVRVEQRSRLTTLRSEAIANGDRLTLRAIGAAPPVFGLGGLGDSHQAAQAHAVLDPEGVALRAKAEGDLQVLGQVAVAVDQLAAEVSLATRDSIASVVAELERREGLQWDGSFGEPLAALQVEPGRSGFPEPTSVADPRMWAA